MQEKVLIYAIAMAALFMAQFGVEAVHPVFHTGHGQCTADEFDCGSENKHISQGHDCSCSQCPVCSFLFHFKAAGVNEAECGILHTITDYCITAEPQVVTSFFWVLPNPRSPPA